MASDEQRAWIGRVLGLQVGGTADPGEGLRERLTDLLQQTVSLPNEAKAALQGQIRQALAGAATANPTQLARVVDALETSVARAAGAARAAQASAAASNVVTFRRLQFAWRDAQDRARDQLEQFVGAVLSDPEIKADPRFDEAAQAASGIADQIPEFGNEIESALGAIDDAPDDAARARARAAARAVLQGYTEVLEDADGLKALQALSDDDYGGISFFGELQKALQSLEEQLDKAA